MIYILFTLLVLVAVTSVEKVHILSNDHGADKADKSQKIRVRRAGNSDVRKLNERRTGVENVNSKDYLLEQNINTPEKRALLPHPPHPPHHGGGSSSGGSSGGGGSSSSGGSSGGGGSSSSGGSSGGGGSHGYDDSIGGGDGYYENDDSSGSGGGSGNDDSSGSDGSSSWWSGLVGSSSTNEVTNDDDNVGSNNNNEGTVSIAGADDDDFYASEDDEEEKTGIFTEIQPEKVAEAIKEQQTAIWSVVAAAVTMGIVFIGLGLVKMLSFAEEPDRVTPLTKNQRAKKRMARLVTFRKRDNLGDQAIHEVENAPDEIDYVRA